MDAFGFLTLKEVLPMIGMSDTWLYEMIKAGKGPPYFRRGRKYLFRRDELEQWAMQRNIDGTGARPRENSQEQPADRKLGG